MKPIRPEVLRAKASVFVQLQERTIELKAKAEELREAQARAHERELLAQRRRFETEVMERQMQQLAETDRRKDEFLAILAHELRNPLQPLQTAVEVLEHDPDKPVPARIRGIVQRQVHHITRLVDDLLDVARFTAGKLELRREPVVARRDRRRGGRAVPKAVDARASTRSPSTAGDAPPTVFGDPMRLVQVLVNLLSNAIKYTEPGGKLEVAWGITGDHAFIRVSDNGKRHPGRSAAEDLRHVRPGARHARRRRRPRPRPRARQAPGRAARRHGPRGQRRRRQGLDVRDPACRSTTQKASRSRNARRPGPTRPLRAVVVDDAPDLRELVADLLRLRGHEVTVVEDGPSAVKLICAEKPDVALIDIGLPEMDGYEVARTLRRDMLDHRVRLIAMTGYGQASDRATAFEAGLRCPHRQTGKRRQDPARALRQVRGSQ